MSSSCYCYISFVKKKERKKEEEKSPNLVYEVAWDVHFGHELANREFWITKLPRASFLVTPSQ
jgi:hypothetical protein